MALTQSFSDNGLDLQASGRPTAPNDAGRLTDAVLETVAYADLFDYPLTSAEIHRYLPGIAASRRDVEDALGNGRLTPHRLDHAGGYYALPGRAAIVEIRQRRAAAAVDLWSKAITYGGWIARLPFVRMVAVTGALAVDNSDPGDDLDYLIVTEPGRLWLCRAIVIGLVYLAKRHGDVVCPNFFLSEGALLLRAHNLYAAHEVAQMVPLTGLPIYHRLRQINGWVETYLPNATGAPREINVKGPQLSRLRAAAEALLRTPPGSLLERWEMHRKIRRLSAQDTASPDLSEADFGPDCCKGHFGGYGGRTLEAFKQKRSGYVAGHHPGSRAIH